MVSLLRPACRLEDVFVCFDGEASSEQRCEHAPAAMNGIWELEALGLQLGPEVGRDRVLHLPGAGFDGLEGHSTLSVALRAPAPTNTARLLTIEQATALLISEVVGPQHQWLKALGELADLQDQAADQAAQQARTDYARARTGMLVASVLAVLLAST